MSGLLVVVLVLHSVVALEDVSVSSQSGGDEGEENEDLKQFLMVRDTDGPDKLLTVSWLITARSEHRTSFPWKHPANTKRFGNHKVVDVSLDCMRNTVECALISET